MLVARSFRDIVSTLIHLFDLRILGAPEDEKRGSVLEQDHKFTPVAVLSGRQLACFCKRGIEMGDGLGVGRARDGAVAGSLVAKACLFGEASETEMMGQHFRLGFRQRGKSRFERKCDALVQHLTPAFEQTFVGGILDQRMFETVTRI